MTIWGARNINYWINGVLADGEEQRIRLQPPAARRAWRLQRRPRRLTPQCWPPDKAFAEWGRTATQSTAECLLKPRQHRKQNALGVRRLDRKLRCKLLHCVYYDEIPAIVDVFAFAGAARC